MGNSKQTIQIKRGKKENIPVLKSGELGFIEDTKELYIGQSNSENLKLFSESTTEKPYPYIKCMADHSGHVLDSTLDCSSNFLPIFTDINYTNVSNYKDYYMKIEPPNLKGPTLGLKKSGVYYITFDAIINIYDIPDYELTSIDLMCVKEFSPYGECTCSSVTNNIDLKGKRGDVRLKGDRIICLNSPKEQPISLALRYNFSSPAYPNPEKILAFVKKLDLEVQLMREDTFTEISAKF